MKHKSNLFLLTSFLAIFLSGAAFAQSGEATYKQVCMSCHGAGVLNAPKFGDKAKWAPLIAEGQVTLTAHGYVGVRAMPAKGGNPNLSIEGFADALVYIVNNSGGNWKSPNPQTIAANEIIPPATGIAITSHNKTTPINVCTIRESCLFSQYI